MKENDPLVLYTDASTMSVSGLLMQEQNRIKKPIILIFHILSDQATTWVIMELELYAFVFCVKQLTLNLMVNYLQCRLTTKISRIRPKLVRLPKESSPFRVPCSHSSHPGRSKCCCRRTHKGHESYERGNCEIKASYVRGGPYTSHSPVRRGMDDGNSNPRRHRIRERRESSRV